MKMDRKFRVPRIWSNGELDKFGELFTGKVVNVSGWKDIDKEGRKYKEYFKNCQEYWITNFKAEARGFQGDQENEIFLDLEDDLHESMWGEFDTVFNHTVLEHIFDVNKAFENLCNLSNDIVIVVVPFLQEQHAEYGDFWRFTPLALQRLFEKNKMDMIYINFNDSDVDSIYVFAIGTKNKDRWSIIQNESSNRVDEIGEIMIGTGIIGISFLGRIKRSIMSLIKP